MIFNHGYIPPDVYRTTERYIAYVDEIASSGFIVFRSDYRGHDRSEGQAGSIYTQPNYSIDVLNAVASVKRHPDADPNRIGMWGHSMGGYITLRSMVVTKDIKAGVIWAGVVARYPDLFTRGMGCPTQLQQVLDRVYSLAQGYGSADNQSRFLEIPLSERLPENLNGPRQLHNGTAERGSVAF